MYVARTKYTEQLASYHWAAISFFQHVQYNSC